jgi:hypothetical protein
VKTKFTLEVIIDSDYDDPDAFASDAQQALENEEDVTIHIAGNVYHASLGVSS